VLVLVLCLTKRQVLVSCFKRQCLFWGGSWECGGIGYKHKKAHVDIMRRPVQKTNHIKYNMGKQNTTNHKTKQAKTQQ
jgi:hypothetical protein